MPGNAGAVRERISGAMMAADRGLVLTRIGGGDALEDTSLYGGFYLSALVLCWARTWDADTAALARRVLAGLLLNASVGEPGFIARGVESDRTTFRGDPSVDQLTGWVVGLWEFHRSALATAAERRRIEHAMAAALARLRRDDYVILRNDRSGRTRFGHLDSVRPTRSERLLAILLAGAHVTGDPVWRREYERLRAARMASLAGFGPFESWVLIQTAASLRVLLALEQRPEVREAYAVAAAEVTAAAVPQMAGFSRFADDPRPVCERLADRDVALRGVRIPVEAAATVLLLDPEHGEARAWLARFLAQLSPAAFTDSRPLVSLEWAHWLAGGR